MPNKSHTMYLLLSLICWGMMLGTSGAEATDSRAPQEDTMLMFVGEDLDVLTIASRREESAWEAPAVAQVITRNVLRERGTDTLGKALETVPGFYMARKEWGTQPWLRGIPDSVLLLYDTVPMTSDISKSLHPFDRELSLNAVKRIEVVKGPGSVLWGPDAFAGIVNVVPMTGKDLDGVETGALYGMPDNRRGGYISMGHDAGRWDAFLSVSGYEGEMDDTKANVVRFGDGEGQIVDPSERFGSDRPGNSRFIEASGNFSYGDWLTLSGRIADNHRSYTMTTEDDLSWLESRDNPTGFIKAEIRKKLDHASALRLTGSWMETAAEQEIIDQVFEQKEKTVYGEILYDRSFRSGSGLFTGGVSYRNKEVDDALILESYLPDYLSAGNVSLYPIINTRDYEDQLWSVFGQYRHRLGDVEAWAGLRYDNHDSYQDRTSLSTGISWTPAARWVVKLLYGTAYRTPFAKQVAEGEDSALENIESVNMQVAWEPSWQWRFGVCGFWSRIEDHVIEDPYAALSEANHQEFTGIELEGKYSPLRSLDFAANLTLVHNKGPDEAYLYNDYVFVRPDGTLERHYVDLDYPYDSGADTLFNLMGTWRPCENVSFFAKLGYFSERDIFYIQDDDFFVGSSDGGVWLLDMNAMVKDVLWGMDLDFSVRNLTDEKYRTPGTYSSIEGEPVSAQIIFRKEW
ncbi:TonB-dependent receptor [Desulfonema ishimotonii]|uniref:TonB-dependent receptor n=1 Tax=Desulfonema ishimotonii TaxID=45657 RepID=A0A401FTB8_9BACT|nr:TonB-dependent receptor [Desulfonema ishimotonii]GBC60200.1 TonB-dependent receptor [Desulfonema ishimotonii]